MNIWESHYYLRESQILLLPIFRSVNNHPTTEEAKIDIKKRHQKSEDDDEIPVSGNKYTFIYLFSASLFNQYFLIEGKDLLSVVAVKIQIWRKKKLRSFLHPIVKSRKKRCHLK